eukprot:7644911-Pyramimonas_sp.AAC.1
MGTRTECPLHLLGPQHPPNPTHLAPHLGRWEWHRTGGGHCWALLTCRCAAPRPVREGRACVKPAVQGAALMCPHLECRGLPLGGGEQQVTPDSRLPQTLELTPRGSRPPPQTADPPPGGSRPRPPDYQM